MPKGKARRLWTILDLFFEREIDKWEDSIPLELRQKNIRDMEASELEKMIAASNDSAGQFRLMTAMFSQAQVEVSNLEKELRENVAKEKICSKRELSQVQEVSQKLAVSLTRSKARLDQLKKKIDQADELDDRAKDMIYARAADMRDAAFNDRLDLIQNNMNQIQSSMNDAMRRQIEILNQGTDFSEKRTDIRNKVEAETASVENDSEILKTLLDAQQQIEKAQRVEVSEDAAKLLEKLRAE